MQIKTKEDYVRLRILEAFLVNLAMIPTESRPVLVKLIEEAFFPKWVIEAKAPIEEEWVKENKIV